MNIVFYDDSSVFGGHQVQVLKAAECLLGRAEVEKLYFFYFPGNTLLGKELERIASSFQKCSVCELDCESKSGQGIRTLFSIPTVMALKTRIAALECDVAVIAQGTIESSSLGLLACRLAGVRTCSYIPLCQTYRKFGSRFTTVRDLVNRFVYYRLPNRFITISRRMAEAIRETGSRVPVSVVPNSVTPLSIDPAKRSECRRRLGNLDHEFVVAVIGRIHFQQKAQDFLVRTVAQNRERLAGVRFLIVGCGPDEPELRRQIHALGLEGTVSLLPWTDDVASVIAATDVLLIPSWFEGVPLVMLEAMSAGLPVVASAVDGMLDLLPAQWLFEPGNSAALVEAITGVARGGLEEVLSRNRERMLAEFSESTFSANFWHVLDGAEKESPSMVVEAEHSRHRSGPIASDK